MEEKSMEEKSAQETAMQKLSEAAIKSTLFAGIDPADMQALLGCRGYHIGTYQKGEHIALEEEHIRYVGIILSGAVDMIKEDLWGNKTLLARMRATELFGETFACGSDTLSIVTFVASENAQILFMSFRSVMHTCCHSCVFHQRLIENMVRIIADKNRDLMRKVEIISKKTLREKIMTYLSVQAQQNGTRYFEIPLGRLELADYLCADRSALARELARMRDDGLIDYDKNTFRIM